MIIRDEQMAVFERAALNGFEDRLVQHVQECFPGEVEVLSEAKTRDAVRDGQERALAYGLVTERDVCKFIDLRFALGQRFDEDPRLPWAKIILNDPATSNPKIRLDRLVQAAQNHLESGGAHG